MEQPAGGGEAVSRETDILEQQIAKNIQRLSDIREEARAIERDLNIGRANLRKAVIAQVDPHITNAEGE